MGKEVNSQIPSNDPYDMYENDEEEEEEEENNNKSNNNDNTSDLPKDIDPDELNLLINVKDQLGTFGHYIEGIGRTYNLTQKGCSKMYVCLTNTFAKVWTIYNYEKKLNEAHSGGIDDTCKKIQIILEDYILYITSMNLDVYCPDFLYRNKNEYTDEEIIDASIAIGDLVQLLSDPDGFDWTPYEIENYKKARRTFKEICSNDINAPIEQRECSCGEIITEEKMDVTEKDKVIDFIRDTLDEINPAWQTKKVIELNSMLQALPCNN